MSIPKLPSLCIPRLIGDIKKSFIEERFNQLKIGKVLKIDMIFKTTEKNEKFYSAFIHIEWNDSEMSKYIIERINTGKDIKIIYDGFLFWKVFMNKSTKQKDYSREKEISREKNVTREKDVWERNQKIF
jgi:hypothetical protein